MIPKIIHQIWIGGVDRMPVHWMRTVVQKHPKWEYILWDEAKIDRLFAGYPKRLREMYNDYYKHKQYHGCSDIVRVLALKRYGGVYIDADTEMLESIDKADFLMSKFFAVEANKWKINVYRIANGIIGSAPHHPVLTEYIERMEKAEEIRPIWNTIGGTMLTEIILKFKDYPKYGIMILPSKSFYPVGSRGQIAEGTSKTYAKHYWGTTKNLY